MEDARQHTIGDEPEKHSNIIEKLCFLAVWIPYAYLVNRFRFVTDDAYITFRYSHNWAMGHGPRYNIGTHVPEEGYSNFLWVAVNAIIERLGAKITFWPLVISFICGSLLLYLVFSTLRRRLKLSLPITCISVLLLSCSPPFTVWSTGGLETMPFALLMFVAFERLILRQKAPAPIIAGICGLAMALTRVEGIYWAVLFAFLSVSSEFLSSKKRVKPALLYLAVVLIPYAVYWVWRFSYYDTLFSNSVYVKAAFGLPTLKRGMQYVTIHYLTFPPLFVSLIGLLTLLRKDRLALGIPVAAMSFGVVCYTISVGGDFMAMGRFLIPGLAFNAILCGWLMDDLGKTSDVRKNAAIIFMVAIIITGVLPAWNVHTVPESMRSPFNFRYNFRRYRSEYEQWVFQNENVEYWERLGRALKSYADPSDTIVCGTIGAIGYYSELFIYDRYGLIDRNVATRKETLASKSPGHNKEIDWRYFLDKKPTYVQSRLLTKPRLKRFTANWSKDDVSSQYVVDFVPLANSGESDDPVYLTVLRRIKDGVDPKTAWRTIILSLNSL